MRSDPDSPTPSEPERSPSADREPSVRTTEASGAGGDRASLRPLLTVLELDGVDLGGLSRYFEPFLRYFVSETLRTGGEVLARTDARGVAGLRLLRPGVRLGTIFARDRASAEALFERRDGATVYAEYPLDPRARTLSVLARDLSAADPAGPFAHRIRAAAPADGPAIDRLLVEVHGGVDEAWRSAPAAPEERAYVAEVGDRLAGVAWVTVVGAAARLHSVSVAPRFRRVGIGTDLLRARLRAARQFGARRAVVEIDDENLASLAIARAGGFERIGAMYEIPP